MREVKHVIGTCGNCCPWKARPFQLPPMPSIPKERNQQGCVFEAVGLDFFLPITVKTMFEFAKRWVAFFTCSNTGMLRIQKGPKTNSISFQLHTFNKVFEVGRCSTTVQISLQN